MAPGLEPAFTSGRPVWPLAGRALADLEPDDPDLAIPHGALQIGIREAPERHFPANRNGLITHMPAEPLGPRPAKTLDLRRKWKFALLASCIFHAAIALFFIQANDEAVLMEGAEFSGIALLGDGADQSKAGDISENDDPAVEVTMITMLEAKPVEAIEAEAVPVEETVEAADVAEAVTTHAETLEPVKETPAEQVTEAKAEPAQPTERAEPQAAAPQTAAQAERTESKAVESRPSPVASETVPEVIATDRIELVEDDNLVQKPAEPQVAEPVDAVETAQPETSQSSEAKAEPVESAKVEPTEITEAEPAETAKVEPAETVKAEPTEVKPVEPVEAAKPKPETKQASSPVEKKPAALKPEKKAERKSAPEKQTAKQKKAEEGKKVAEKADAKAKKSGNGGQNQTNARRGQADGQEKGDSKQASRGGSKNGEVGNAAASNYPGKVRSKLARVARSVRAKGRGEVVVAFAVGSNGSVRSARVTRSSGVASVDQAALQAIRKASPFPPIPAGAGRSSWDFSIPLAFMR